MMKIHLAHKNQMSFSIYIKPIFVLALYFLCGNLFGDEKDKLIEEKLLNSLIERITIFDYQSLDASKGFSYYWKTDGNWKNIRVFKEGLAQELLINVNFCKDVETAKRLFNREWRGFAIGIAPHQADDMIIVSPSRGEYGYILFRDGNVVYEVMTAEDKESSFNDIVELIACIASKNEHNKKIIEELIERLKKEKGNREAFQADR